VARNTYSEFVGLAKLKQKHHFQLVLFEEWAAERKWMHIHTAHYDWWMFPIDSRSSFGYAWTVFSDDVAELKEDPVFVKEYLRGVQLLALAWGWDLYAKDWIPEPDKMQCWQDWPIRLYKCAKSLKLFGYQESFESMRKYALLLINEGESMQYRGRDLSGLFLNG